MPLQKVLVTIAMVGVLCCGTLCATAKVPAGVPGKKLSPAVTPTHIPACHLKNSKTAPPPSAPCHKNSQVPCSNCSQVLQAYGTPQVDLTLHLVSAQTFLPANALPPTAGSGTVDAFGLPPPCFGATLFGLHCSLLI